MARLATLERLMDAYDATTRASIAYEANPTHDNARAEVFAEQRLLDAAIDAGMPNSAPSSKAWAAERVTRFLMAA